MNQAYGYTVRNGCYEDALYTSHPFIIFAENDIVADEWIERYIKRQIEDDKYQNDDGNIVNWWWKYYSVEKAPPSKFDGTSTNIVWLWE